MVRRLMRGGTRVRGLRRPPAGGEGAGRRGCHRRRFAGRLRQGAPAAAGGLADGARRPGGSDRSTELSPLLGLGRHRDRRRQLLLPRRHPPRRGAEANGHSLCRRRHQRRRLGAGARLLPDDRRRAGRSSSGSIPIFAALAPGMDAAPRTAGREGRRRHRRAGLSPLRPGRRRALREDGAQRHRVRPDGGLRRRAQHPAPRRRRRCDAQEADAETTPLRHPEHYQYRLRPRARSPRSGAAAA